MTIPATPLDGLQRFKEKAHGFSRGDESDTSRNNYIGSCRRLCCRVSGKDMHASGAVNEAHYPSRGSNWHGPQPHRAVRRVGNLSVVGTVCDRGTPRLQSWEDVSGRVSAGRRGDTRFITGTHGDEYTITGRRV